MDVIELAGKAIVYGLKKIDVPRNFDELGEMVAKAVHSIDIHNPPVEGIDNLIWLELPLGVYAWENYNIGFSEVVKRLVTAELMTAKGMNLMELYHNSMKDFEEFAVKNAAYDHFKRDICTATNIAHGFANLVEDIQKVVQEIFEKYGEPVIDIPEAVYSMFMPRIAEMDPELAAAIWYSSQKIHQKVWWGCLFLKIEAVEWLKVLAEESDKISKVGGE